ncbi:MAG: hypothetical protein EOO75_05445, partial [Myxococcales bacterium]
VAPVPAAQRPRASVAGRVLDPERKAVGGASVCAWVPRDGMTTAQVRAPRCAVTGADGAYALADLFPVTALVISVSASGFPPEAYRGPDGSRTVRLAEGEQRSGVDIVLRAGGVALKGRVNDVTGGAVAGALIATDTHERDAPSLATSDAQGEFTLWVDPGPVQLLATAPGYAPGRASGPAPGHFFSLYLVPGATLVGRAVVAGSETPVAGAKIASIQVEGGGSTVVARSDDDGHFKIEGLSPGRYRIEATSEGREGYSHASVTLGMGETSAEVVVEMDPAYVVRGRVVDKATGQPCPGGEVTITDNGQNEFSEATIDPDGWARMASVIPGKYEVTIRCDGHIAREDYPAVIVVDRDLPEITWEVKRGARLRVDVVDAQGQPVRRVRLNASTMDERPGGYTDRPEADGSYLLSGLEAGLYDVSASGDDGGHASKEVTVDAQREDRIRIELPLTGGIDGLVEDEDHKPVAGIVVAASGPRNARAQSLDDGTFSFKGLPSGEYVVTASDGPMRRVRRRPPGPPDDGEPREPEVTVTVASPGRARTKIVVPRRSGVIEGRVADGAGGPVVDAFLEYVKASGGSKGVPRYMASGRAPIVTDNDGHFRIENLEAGQYNLRAYRKGGGEATVDGVATGRRDVALRIGDGASISGVLASSRGPIERFSLQVSQREGRFHRSEYFFHAGGNFALRDLPAGTYQITAETPDGGTSAEVTLAEGEQKKDLRLTLTLRGVVEGRVVALGKGTPVAGVHVSIGDNTEGSVSAWNGPGRKEIVTGPDGRFRLEGVLGGKRTVVLGASEGETTFDTVAVPVTASDGGTTDVGALRVPLDRAHGEQPRGDVGLELNRGPDGSLTSLEIASVSGAAEAAGLKAGDQIVSVDGIDVSGDNRYLF